MLDAHLGYRTLANDYLSCVAFLQKGYETRNLLLRFDSPVLANLAHATELAIKGHLLSLGLQDDDLAKLGHDLEGAFQRLHGLSAALTMQVEGEVKAYWKDLLRGKRDELREALMQFGIHDPAHLREFGVLSNQEIGDELPTFKQDLKWLSDRHKSSGGKFRYFESGLNQRRHVQAFGLDVFTVPVSISIGTKILVDRIA